MPRAYSQVRDRVIDAVVLRASAGSSFSLAQCDPAASISGFARRRGTCSPQPPRKA